jgi:hypothetical protein
MEDWPGFSTLAALIFLANYAGISKAAITRKEVSSGEIIPDHAS